MHFRITITTGTGFTAKGEPLSPFQVTTAQAKARGLIAGICGGYTEMFTSGGWVDPKGELVTERGLRWVTLHEAQDAEHAEYVARELAGAVAHAFQQECVVLELEPVPTVSFVAPTVPAAALAVAA